MGLAVNMVMDEGKATTLIQSKTRGRQARQKRFETMEAKLPDGTVYTWEVPNPPGWAKDDPELWEMTLKEQSDKSQQKARDAAWKERLEHKANEINSLKAAFHEFDEDDSGSLEHDEVKAILMRAGGGHPMTDADAEEFLKEFDHDGNGSLDMNECTPSPRASPSRRLGAHACAPSLRLPMPRPLDRPAHAYGRAASAVIDAMRAMAGMADLDPHEELQHIADRVRDGTIDKSLLESGKVREKVQKHNKHATGDGKVPRAQRSHAHRRTCSDCCLAHALSPSLCVRADLVQRFVKEADQCRMRRR